MPGTLTTLTTLRDLIGTTLDEIAGLTVYPSGGVLLDQLPAIEVKLPRIERVPVDEEERELGTVTWITEWPLELYVSAEEPSTASDQALQFLALIVAKFDEDETLGSAGFNLLCRLTEASESDGSSSGDAKPTRGYDLTLSVLQLV